MYKNFLETQASCRFWASEHFSTCTISQK